MKPPVLPPYKDVYEFRKEPDAVKLILNHTNLSQPVDNKGRYVHWDKLRHLEAPEGITPKQWWGLIKNVRLSHYKPLPFIGLGNHTFKYALIDQLHEKLHWLDLNTAGNVASDGLVAQEGLQKTYLIRSLVEESINSSQLEGASTTVQVAKEMIRQGRQPKDHSEQMIFNNYQAMQFVQQFKGDKLTPSMVMELHKLVTENTLEDPNKAGKFRSAEDKVYVSDNEGGVLHTPPPAEELEDRLSLLCQFANEESDAAPFVHPILRAIILHFMLAYDHPFIDGNGRTARALFYWAVAKENYWLLEFTTISKIIKRAPVKYGMAFLHTETDELDLTYFILHQLDVIRDAVTALHEYLEMKSSEIREAQAMLANNKKLHTKLNARQLALIKHALKHPRFTYNIYEHQNTHGVVYETARRDLMQLADKYKLLKKLKDGKTMLFLAPDNLKELLQ